jgi:hypothetical protein
MLDYINTNTFRDMAHYVVMPNQNKPFISDILRRNAIIYCKTDYTEYLFSNLKFSGRKYILITHSSDYSIEERLFKLRPPCIIKWYAEFAKYIHPDLITIPAGLTPNKDLDKTWLDLDWFVDNIERLKSNTKDIKTLYCSWTIRNNVKKRSNVLQKLKNNNLEYIWDYPNFPNNIDELLQKELQLLKEGKTTCKKFNELACYYNYCENMSKYKFVIAPEGNGDGDTQRVWEALYMGCFPVVLKNNVYREYATELPIIQVKDYSEVTYDLLNSYLNREYNYEKLYMEYWKKRIIKEFEKL